MAGDPDNWRLYVITDSRLSDRGHLEIARAAIAGGAEVIQFREKAMSTGEMHDICMALREMTAEADVDFIVNDRLDLALAVDADGVHLGQDDLPLDAAREILGPEKLIGGSAKNLVEAKHVEAAGADYVGVGPVFEARHTKPDTIEPQGVKLISQVISEVSMPVVAIGGINRANVRSVIQAGARVVSVISDIVTADDMQSATSELRRLIVDETDRLHGQSAQKTRG